MVAIDYCFNDELNTYVFVVKDKDTNEPIIKKYDTNVSETIERLQTTWNAHWITRLNDNTLK